MPRRFAPRNDLSYNRRMRRSLGRLLTLGGFLGLALVLYHQSASLPWNEVSFKIRPLAGAMTYFISTMALGFAGWWVLLNRGGKILPPVAAYRLFGTSWLSRYLPGGTLWQYVALGSRSPSPEIAVASVSAYFFSTLLGLMAGALLAVSTIREVWHPPGLLGIQLVAAIALALVFAAITHEVPLRRLTRLLQSRFPSVASLQPVPARVAATAFAANLISWMAQAVGAYLLWTLVRAETSQASVAFFLGAYTVAFLGAYFTFLTPSGMGLREGAFAALLATQLPAGEATFVGLGTGLALLLAEVIFMIPLLWRVRSLP